VVNPECHTRLRLPVFASRPWSMTTDHVLWISDEAIGVYEVQMGCARQDSNLHALRAPGPKPT
jgi:hypothetical protein